MNLEALLNNSETLNVSEEILKELKNKTILITGAAGSIGSEIAKILVEKCNCSLILLDQSESGLYQLQQLLINHQEKFEIVIGNICDKRRMKLLFKQFQIDVIYHAAAYKHVPLMEENPSEAVRVNIEGTKIIADLALKNNIDRFILISTDKAINPTNVMGASKHIAELYINSLTKNKTKFITTRFGNVLGSNGSVIPLFKSQIENGGPITVTHKDIKRFFMTVSEACQLVLEASIMGEGGEIFVFDMGSSIRIFDLAKHIIELEGLNYPDDIDIKIVGLRPGEKINEESLMPNKENMLVTRNEKIMISPFELKQHDFLKVEIQKLIKINKKLDFKATVGKMKAIVPEFISNNSKFQELDKMNE